MSESMLSIQNLSKYFPITGGIFGRRVGWIHAVESVSLRIERGEIVGLVGESGCGKSTLGKCVLRLYEPTRGEIQLMGENFLSLKGRALRSMRRKAQMIFQDPYSSLNPRFTVEAIVGEGISIHRLARSRAERRERVLELMSEVGLRPEYIERYPHEFSGGQRQRIGIARALAVEPEFIVADEPVSALDVSIQAQITNLLLDLKARRNLTYLFISHDLKIVKHLCDRVVVMYLGRVMEEMPASHIPDGVQHPYTQALVSAIPVPDPTAARKRTILSGDVPSPIQPPSGCVFHTRCPIAVGRCRTEVPVLTGKSSRHRVACHLREV